MIIIVCLTPVTWFDYAFRGISSCAILGRLALVAGFVRLHPPRVGRRLCACLLLFLRDHGAPATLRAAPLGLCCSAAAHVWGGVQRWGMQGGGLQGGRLVCLAPHRGAAPPYVW